MPSSENILIGMIFDSSLSIPDIMKNIIIILAATLLLLACRKEQIIYTYTISHTSDGYAGDVVHFSCSAPAYARQHWDFGDNTAITGPQPQHVYTKPGIYPVQVTLEGMDTVCRDTVYVGHPAAKNMPGTYVWHYIYTNAQPWPPYHTSTIKPDVSLTVLQLDSYHISIGDDVMELNASASSDTMLVYTGFYLPTPMRSLTLTWHTVSHAFTYTRDVHVSAAAGNETHYYYTP